MFLTQGQTQFVGSELGGFEYVFKGWYKVNHEQSLKTGKVAYDRISKTMPTYYPSGMEQPTIIAKAVVNNHIVAHLYEEEEIKRFNTAEEVVFV